MILLAQTNPFGDLFKELGSAFRAEGASWPALIYALRTIILILIVAVPLFLFVRGLVRRFDPTAGPSNLFNAAMRVCRLSLMDRLLLGWLARRMRVEHPTSLLLARPLYRQTVAEACRKMNPLWGEWSRRRLARIEPRLFGGDSPPQGG